MEKDTSSSTVIGTFKSKSGEQLNTCWSFISLECEVENRLSWITKIEPELMMEVSLVLSVRQLHDGQNHSLSDSKTSGFKRLEKEYLETMGLLECLIFPLWQRNRSIGCTRH